jgi:hypothetical protein
MTDNTQELINKLTNAISFKFKEDGTSPGLTISRLRNSYYCSVVRYPKGSALSTKNKVVVCKAEADTLDSALKTVAKEFVNLAKVQRDPLQELSDIVQGA